MRWGGAGRRVGGVEVEVAGRQETLPKIRVDAYIIKFQIPKGLPKPPEMQFLKFLIFP